MDSKRATKKARAKQQLYGIAEWYGRRFASLDDAQRKKFAATKKGVEDCPFVAQVPNLAPKNKSLKCSKQGGVCSIRKFIEPVFPEDDIKFGPIIATCPNRFLQNGTIIEHIGSLILGTNRPWFAKELPFLKRPRADLENISVPDSDSEIDNDTEDGAVVDLSPADVGRIDLVFVHPTDPEKWCAVEMQAVYFAGASMASDITAIINHTGNGVPMPAKARRPDFRSSGPKRLMPQLMIKVPTIRRWGKKMLVVVDQPFFEAMDKMETVEHLSNSDVIWVVVRFEEINPPDQVNLVVSKMQQTTLESAVKGLTAGEPTTLPDFEESLSKKKARALPD